MSLTMRGLIHCHTYHSFDSLLPPEAYLWYADRLKLDFLCITDHNTLAGSLQAARHNRNPNLQVVVGAEYATDRGDVIGLFLREEIATRAWAEVIAAIHAQGGIALLPHPHKGHQLCPELWQAVDLVETFNARTDSASNRQAEADTERYAKPRYAGADIHTAWELLTNQTLLELNGEGPLDARLRHAPRQLQCRETWLPIHKYSQVIKRLRRYAGFPGKR